MRTTLIFVCAASLVLCGAATAPGVIQDERGKPIEGAFIITTWHGEVPNPVQSEKECYSVAIARTDAQGRYQVPNRAPDSALLLSNKYQSVVVYAPGYQSAAVPYSGGITVLRAPEKKGTVRVVELSSRLPFHCAARGGRDRELLPLLKAAYQEAASIASPDDRRAQHTVLALKGRIELLEKADREKR